MDFRETRFIATFQKGNEKAFKEIFDTYYKPLCLFGYRFCISQEYIVEDCVQDVLFKCWQDRKNFDNISNIQSYLYTSVKNKILSELRHLKVEKNYTSNLDPNKEITESFENIIIEEEVKRQLIENVNELPTQCRKIFNLLIQGATYNDVAESLDISINTVKSQRKRAISLLKDKIQDSNLLSILI